LKEGYLDAHEGQIIGIDLPGYKAQSRQRVAILAVTATRDLMIDRYKVTDLIRVRHQVIPLLWAST